MITHGLLPKDYFLDKNFYLLKEHLVKKLRNRDYGDAKITLGEFANIITDVLLELKPTFKQVKALDLTKKYDIALSFIFKQEDVDKIAEAKNEEKWL